MNIWTAVFDALKGEANSSDDSTVDSRAIHILESEVTDASGRLQDSRNDVANLISQVKTIETSIKSCDAAIEEHEGYAQQALEKDNEALASEVAYQIVKIEDDRSQHVNALENIKPALADMQRIVSQAELKLNRLKQQLATIKVTENVQKAQSIVIARHSDQGQTQTAQDALARLKDKHSRQKDKIQRDLTSNNSYRKESLLEKLKQAGISSESSQIEDVLRRLKAKK